MIILLTLFIVMIYGRLLRKMGKDEHLVRQIQTLVVAIVVIVVLLSVMFNLIQ